MATAKVLHPLPTTTESGFDLAGARPRETRGSARDKRDGGGGAARDFECNGLVS